MRVLSFDQASKIAWSFFDGKELVKYETKDFNKIKDFSHRMNEIKKYFKSVVEQYAPDCVTVEDIQMQGNNLVYAKLSGLKYLLIDTLIDLGIKYDVIPSVTYRSYFKITTNNREKCKSDGIEFVNRTFNLNLNDNDICDAIVQGYYFANKTAL